MTATTATPPRRRPAPQPRAARWWPDALGSAAIFSLLVVVALWVGNGNVQALARGWAGVTSLGRLTGLVSADLLLIQVLLMARIPWIERTYGQDRLARWHQIGRASCRGRGEISVV